MAGEAYDLGLSDQIANEDLALIKEQASSQRLGQGTDAMSVLVLSNCNWC
jgi:hypothetical protein